jgi:hypothetical protein
VADKTPPAPHRNLRNLGDRQSLPLSTNKKAEKHKAKHLQKKSSATFTEKDLRGHIVVLVSFEKI